MLTADTLAAAVCELEGFEFVSLVGTGAFKYTFHVVDHGRSLALKLFKAGTSARSVREIQAMRRCDHPSIAKFIALKTIELGGERYEYLLEEFFAGGSLAQHLGKLEADTAARLTLKLCEALAHLSTHNLVHRDIKPDNIMFRDETLMHPVLVDFGLVRDLSAVSLTPSHALMGPGTPMFAAPEQLNNEKGMIDWRTDQFGLAATVTYAVWESHPYAHSGDAIDQTLGRVAAWQNPSSEFASRCRATVLGPLIQMVRPFPIERFGTGDGLVRAWRQAVSS